MKKSVRKNKLSLFKKSNKRNQLQLSNVKPVENQHVLDQTNSSHVELNLIPREATTDPKFNVDL